MGDFCMQKKLLMLSVAAALSYSNPALSSNDYELLKQEIEQLKQSYETRIQALEQRLKTAEKQAHQANTTAQDTAKKVNVTGLKRTADNRTDNSFNPALSVILDGRYADFNNDPDAYELPGFALGGEAGLGKEGFSIGHTEITASANIDDQFYGELTVAIHEHDDETEVEVEQAYVQTLGLGNGLTVKAGRFYSAMGYINEQHEHAWDFADAPLIYRGLFGNQLYDDGVQVSYIAPTELFFQMGAELLSGDKFPAGGNSEGIGAWTAFANLGGDIGIEHSWSLGLSHWKADDIDGRTSGGHSHGGDSEEVPSFSGESKITALDLVYKWAPNGNPKNRNFKFQFEYFMRDEDGTITMLNSDPLETSTYDGDQSGWYAQAVYQFMPQWRTGFRYDQLDSDNIGSDSDILEEAGLDDEGHTPKRYSAMLEWLPSEYSRIRLQFNHDESYEESDNQVLLQYTHSLGSHGAHNF
jgi:hypothetical protein